MQVIIVLYIMLIATYSLVGNSNITQFALALGPNCLLKCMCQILRGCKLEQLQLTSSSWNEISVYLILNWL